MRKTLTVISLAVAVMGMAACADTYRDGPGPGAGFYGPEPVAYDGYYDDFYGPFYDGYWAGDGGFYYTDAPGHAYHRDTGGHFRHESVNGFHPVHGTGAGRHH